MTQIGTVEKIIQDGTAVVSVARVTACAHDCNDCAGCGMTASPIRCTANNVLGAHVGDKVVIESSNSTFFKVAIAVYLVPFLTFFLGYSLLNFLQENIRVWISCGIFLISFALLIFYDRRVQKKNSITYKIVRII